MLFTLSFDPTPLGFDPASVGLEQAHGLRLLQRARNHDTSLAILAGLGGATQNTDCKVSSLSDLVVSGSIRDNFT